MEDRAFAFMPLNVRPGKPRARGLTEIRGAYYSVVGLRYLEDLLEMMHPYVDGLKFAGGSFALMPVAAVKRLIERVKRAGLKPKPELGIQFGAGGATAAAELAAEGKRDADWVISRARACLGAGAEIIMIESEGITENVERWRTDIIGRIIDAVGVDKVMFEAADPAVFEWYVKNQGAEVNLFIDHSQIVQLEALRSGIWGTKGTWGRVLTYKGT